MSDTPNHESDAIEEMISTLVQIAWDAGNQEEEAIFDDEYNQIYDRLLQCINTKDTEIKRLEARCKELESELSDINEQYKLVMEERCSPDEHHCTCVPFLRQRIAELESENANLKCCGNCKSFNYCQFLISDTDVIVKSSGNPVTVYTRLKKPENFDCDKWEGRK